MHVLDNANGQPNSQHWPELQLMASGDERYHVAAGEREWVYVTCLRRAEADDSHLGRKSPFSKPPQIFQDLSIIF